MSKIPAEADAAIIGSGVGGMGAALALAEDYPEVTSTSEGAEGPGGADRIRARILAACGRTAEAVELQREIVAAHPEDGPARVQYGVYLERLGLIDEAIAELEALFEEREKE